MSSRTRTAILALITIGGAAFIVFALRPTDADFVFRAPPGWVESSNGNADDRGPQNPAVSLVDSKDTNRLCDGKHGSLLSHDRVNRSRFLFNGVNFLQASLGRNLVLFG